MKKLLSFLIAIVICVGLGSCSANIYPDDYDCIYSTRTVYYPVHHHHGHHHRPAPPKKKHDKHHHRPGSKTTHRKSSYDRPSKPKSNSHNSSRGGNTRSNGNRG